MTTWIAEEPVVFVHPNGTRNAGRIAIGMPIQREQDCACQIELDGMERSVAIYGDSTLQALLLASRFLGMRLHSFLSQGGRVVYPPGGEDGDDTDMELSAIFGALLRAPEPTQSPNGT